MLPDEFCIYTANYDMIGDEAHVPGPGQLLNTRDGARSAASLVVFRGHTWQWAVGGFLFFVGGAMLVAPHEYDVVWRTLPLPYPAWWGGLYMLGGLGLLALATLVRSPRFTAAAYLLAAALLGIMVGAYAATGRLIGVAGYAPLAAGCLLGWYIVQRRAAPAKLRVGQADLLLCALGLCGAFSGLVLLATPGRSTDPAFDPIRPLLPWSGLVLLVGGALLAALPLLPLPASRRRQVLEAASIASGILCLIYVLVALSQAADWPGIAYFGWFGLVFAAQPILERRAAALLVPGSLRTWLTCLLAAAVAIPLITVVGLDTDRMERVSRADTLARQAVRAGALAQGVADYVGLNRAALAALAAQPGLAEMPRPAQDAEVEVYHRAFPDMLAFMLYNADGVLITRHGDGPVPNSLAGHPGYEIPRATGRPALEIWSTPNAEHPVVYFAAPIFDREGHFAGIAASALQAARLAKLLDEHTPGWEHSYLVSDAGRVIVHPDQALMAAFADLTRAAPVAQALAGPQASGSVTYDSDSGETLAGDARVPGLGWIAVVEQPAAEVLAGVRETRRLVFNVLLLSLLAITVAGWWVAGRLARPLVALAGAAEALAQGDVNAPLPQTNVLEANQLAQAFRQMRAVLAAHTTQLERSESSLRASAAQLVRANQTLSRSRLQLQALTRRLLEVQETERRALSRDLHDTAAQSITSLKIGLTILERDPQCPDDLRGQIAELQQISAVVMEDLHRLAVNLRPSSLDRNGLVAALEQLIAAFGKQTATGVDFVVQGMTEDTRLPAVVETALYRIVQEALTNVARHAQAGYVAVVLQHSPQQVRVIIEDDGAGFDAEEALHSGRLGLLGMRERVEMLNGKLTIESAPGEGTTVYAEVPLEDVLDVAETEDHSSQ